MNRIVLAAALAVGLHGMLFWAAAPRTRPVLPLACSQSMTINLVSVRAPVKKAPAPAPKKVQPPPKAKPKPRQPEKRTPKPVVHPRRTPRPPEPDPTPVPSVAVKEIPAEEPPAEAEPPDPGPVSHQERAAVRESVPLYDLNPPPVYPRVARRRNYQGTVLLDVRVTAEGSVAEAKVAQSSGYSVLDRSALNSVRNWRFEPARRGARPIEAWVQVPVRFELR
jgi:protein TonB